MSKPKFLSLVANITAGECVAKEYPMASDSYCDDNPPEYSCICTRPFGHTGPHVAHAEPSLAVAIWQYDWELVIN